MPGRMYQWKWVFKREEMGYPWLHLLSISGFHIFCNHDLQLRKRTIRWSVFLISRLDMMVIIIYEGLISDTAFQYILNSIL